MRDELMTGWLNPNPFISEMTVASFVDIGFTGPVTAVPEPSSTALMALALGVGMRYRRRPCRGNKPSNVAKVEVTLGEQS